MIKRKSVIQLRPPLRQVAPLTYWISAGFALVNFAIFWLLAQIPVTAIKQVGVPIVSNPFFTFQNWGIWFLFLGCMMAIGLYQNNWTLLKRALIMGLISKLMWTYALLYMISHGLPVFATFILWAFLAWAQAWTIIYFSPTVKYDLHDRLRENEVA